MRVNLLTMTSLPAITLIRLDQSSCPPVLDLRSQRVEEFFRSRSLSPNTERAYRRDLTRFLEWTPRPWPDITPRIVSQFRQHLRDQGLAPTSINRILSSLSSFTIWLRTVYSADLERDVMLGIEYERVSSPPALDLFIEQGGIPCAV